MTTPVAARAPRGSVRADGPGSRIRRAGAAVLPATGRPGAGELVLAAVVAVATAVVFLIRQPGDALDAPWAEDGTVFLTDAYRGSAATLLHPYAGYLHIYPRLVALVAAAVPVASAAPALAVAGVLPPALAAATAVIATRGWIRSPALRAVLGLFFVLFPYGAAEIAANVANAHWFFISAAAIALAWRTDWRPATWWTVTVVLLAALTDPLTGLLLPVAVMRLLAGPVTGRGRGAVAGVWAPVLALLGGLVVQAYPAASTFGATQSTRPRPDLSPLGWQFLRHVPAAVLLGEPAARGAGTPLILGCAGVVVVAVVLLAVRRPPLLPGAVAGVGYGALFWALPNYLRSLPQIQSGAPLGFAADSRYAVIAVVLFAVVVLAALDALTDARRGAGAVVAVLAAVGVVVGQAPDLHNGFTRTPSWSAGVAAATIRCRSEPAGTVTIPIAPRGWQVTVPCARLRGL